MLDDRVRAVLARLEAEDEADTAAGLPVAERSLAVGPEAGRLLFALVAPNPGCEVLEIGASRGYSTIWLAAAARILGGRVVSLEQDPVKCEAWRRNLADAGLEEHGRARRGRRAGDAARARRRLRRRLPRRLEARLRGAVLPRAGEGRSRRRDRGRQRRLTRGRARRVRGGAAVRSRASSRSPSRSATGSR